VRVKDLLQRAVRIEGLGEVSLFLQIGGDGCDYEIGKAVPGFLEVGKEEGFLLDNGASNRCAVLVMDIVSLAFAIPIGKETIGIKLGTLEKIPAAAVEFIRS